MGEGIGPIGPAAVALIVVLSGCGAGSFVGGGGSSGPGTATPDRTATPATPTGAETTATATASPTPAVATPDPDETTRVTVVGVVDGDTLRVESDDGTRATVTLVGADAPDLDGEIDPGNFEGVPAARAGRDCLEDWAGRADDFVRERLRGQAVGLTFPEGADGLDPGSPTPAYVFSDGDLVNLRLVREGYARVADGEFSGRSEFETAESAAAAAGRGLWACRDVETPTPTATPTATATPTPASPTGIRVVEINAEGGIREESIVIENTGDAPVDLTGWRIKDSDGNSFTFPDGFRLEIGETVTLHSSRGSQTESDLYWWAEEEVWNDDGDTVAVIDESGQRVYERSYS